MAKSLRAWCPEDTVQEMYLRLNKYVQEPERIMYEHGEVNTMYVYLTLKNIVRNEQAASKRDVVAWRCDCSGGVAKGVDYFTDILCELEWEEEEYQDIVDLIHDEVKTWHWYDQKLFNIYYIHEPEKSIRKLSKDTRISTRSIFNTLKNGREKIRNALREAGKL